jgi:hypothetical protein
VVALTLPAESLLLRALATSTTQEAVQTWAFTLDAKQLSSAADTIQMYPFVYRQAIMRALTPDRRAAVWQHHIKTYMAAHPELDGSTVAVLNAAMTVLTPDVLSKPTPAARASMHAIADQLVGLIGRDQASYVLHDLGPREIRFSSAEPWNMRLANYLRDNFVALARAGSCDCATSYGCYSYSGICSTAEYCTVDDSWPACGWGWLDPCNGTCISGT